MRDLMVIAIHDAPDELMESLKDANATQTKKCFENCLIAVLGLRSSRKLQYVLGILTAPGYEPVAHAWLAQERKNDFVYFDPTLQATSTLWSARKSEFIYEQRYIFTKEQLLNWFRIKYADRQFTALGIPEGDIRGPILNGLGELE